MNYFKSYFLDIITKKYFQLKGRAPRREFWFFMLFSFLASFVLGLIGTALGLEYVMHLDTLATMNELSGAEGVTDFPINLVQIAISLLLMLPSFAVSVRRLHDIGKSGWWQLVALVPLLGIFVLLVFFLLPSQEGKNDYGDFPRN